MPAQRKLPKQQRKKQSSSELSGGFFLLAFTAAGLGTTMSGMVRGDKELYTIAFAFCIGYCCLEIIIDVVAIYVEACGKSTLSTVKAVALALGNIASLVLLGFALDSSSEIEYSDAAGCANGFGCANIMAIIAAIGFGIRVFIIPILACCLFGVACSTCCYAICCASSDQADEEAPAEQTEKLVSKPEAAAASGEKVATNPPVEEVKTSTAPDSSGDKSEEKK